jgi:RNA polymerase sigma-70 factor (ECF subfamily)
MDVGERGCGMTKGPQARSVTYDHDRLKDIYDSYSGVILAYALRRLGNVDDAVDVVAETFAVAWRRIDDVPAGDQARPWLYGVARRVLANQRRSNLRRLRLEDKLKLAAQHSVDEPLSGGDLSVETREALGRLSGRDREVLTLAAWDGLDTHEIAVALGCSSGAARVQLHRARRRFEKLLGIRADVTRGSQPGMNHSEGQTPLPTRKDSDEHR